MKKVTLVAALLLALANASCSAGPTTDRPNGVQEQPAPSASPQSPVPLHAVPPAVAAECRRADERFEFPILCPEVLPVPTDVAKGAMELPESRLLVERKRFMGLEFWYSAPHPRDPSQNRPDRFLHFAVLNPAFPYSDEGWHSMGKRELGGKTGELWRGPSIASYHQGHLIFAWEQDGTGYEVSLHGWDNRRDSLALLSALVASLKMPSEL